MAITLNKVGVEIDGKVYEFYKMSFKFQRQLIELQSNIDELTNKIAKEHGISPEEVNDSDKVPTKDKLEIAKASLAMQEVLASLFVDPDDAVILDNFSGDNVAELINSLQ